jgi:DNA polymerase alpha subunit B
MAEEATQIRELFASSNPNIPGDVLHELMSITRLLSIDAQELFYKWESYVLKMGTDNTKLEYKTVKDFKKDLQDALERDTRAKGHHAAPRRTMAATPRAGASGGDMFDMLGGVTSTTPRNISSVKRKAGDFQTTPTSKTAKNGLNSSPAPIPSRDNASISFADRQNAGHVMETLNGHVPAAIPPEDPATESRVRLKANTEMPKFAYKPMAMQLSSASEILDDRIDSFTELIQEYHNLPDSSFGNPAAQSSSEVVAVGRIACDQPDGKLNAASVVLETSRRMGAGMRVPLKFENGTGYDLFPGKIVAIRGTNVSGEYFSVSETLPLPLLPPAASTPSELEVYNERLADASGETRPLSYLIASGPYTPETDLTFPALHSLISTATTQRPDVLILTGPFLDLEHPLLASGDLENHLPPDTKLNPDTATMTDVFRALIANPLHRLVQSHPTITIILVPSVRDVISKHVSFPQDRLPRATLGLPKQCQIVTNPITLSINEVVFGISSHDILSELRRENVYAPGKSGAGFNDDLLARLSGHLIDQRHYFPVFPAQSRENLPKLAPVPGEVPAPGQEERQPIGANLDISYLKLAEWLKVRPDVLILPSTLTPFAKVRIFDLLCPCLEHQSRSFRNPSDQGARTSSLKKTSKLTQNSQVVDSVLCINPGTLSKRRGAGTYAAMTLAPRSIATDEEREAEVLSHNVFERARVDVTRV